MITADGANDVIRGGAGDDGPLIGDHNPVCGVPSGHSGNDSLFGDDGDDQLHGDNFTDLANPEVDSGDGRDSCNGGAGTDTAALCESIVDVP